MAPKRHAFVQRRVAPAQHMVHVSDSCGSAEINSPNS